MDVQLSKVKLFDSISPSQVAEYQKRDTQLSLVYEYVAGAINLNCLKYTMLGQGLSGGYFFSLTSCL